jgi:hypothetical protein
MCDGSWARTPADLRRVQVVKEDTDRFGYNTDLNTPPSTEHALRAVKGERRVVWFMNVR